MKKKSFLILFLITLYLIPNQLLALEDVRLYYETGGVLTLQHDATDLKTMYEWIRDDWTSRDKNKNWVIHIYNDTYSSTNWHGIIWVDSKTYPNSGYYLKIRPSANLGVVTIDGTTTYDEGWRFRNIDNGCRIIIEQIEFKGHKRRQLVFEGCDKFTIQDCIFRDMLYENSIAVGAIVLDDCDGNISYTDIIIRRNNFINLNSGWKQLHAIYMLGTTYSYIERNYIEYCSGSVFKCVAVDGTNNTSDYNKFYYNTIGGCGDDAYFSARPSQAYPDNLTFTSKGNKVIRTIVTGHLGESSYGRTTSAAYGADTSYIRMFVCGKEAWDFPEYEWDSNPTYNNYEDRFDSNMPFYMARTGHQNEFKTVSDGFDVNIDKVIGESRAYIYLASNPAGNANNRLHRGKYIFNANGTGAFISDVDDETIYDTSDPYTDNATFLNKIEINETSRKPRTFDVDFYLLTCEGDTIFKGDLAGTNGVLELEKWLVENTSGIFNEIDNIQGAGQLINFSNSGGKLMVLYNSYHVSVAIGTSFNYTMVNGSTYTLEANGPTTVTMRPQAGISKSSNPGTEFINLPNKFDLFENYPNPFNPSTTIKFQLPQDARATIDIYDAKGRYVKELTNSYFMAGAHSIIWDGTDENGSNVPSGTYICRLKSGQNTKSIKLLLLK